MFDPDRPLHPQVRDMIAVYTRGLKVMVNHRGELKRKYRITGIADVAANKDTYVGFFCLLTHHCDGCCAFFCLSEFNLLLICARYMARLIVYPRHSGSSSTSFPVLWPPSCRVSASVSTMHTSCHAQANAPFMRSLFLLCLFLSSNQPPPRTFSPFTTGPLPASRRAVSH